MMNVEAHVAHCRVANAIVVVYTGASLRGRHSPPATLAQAGRIEILCEAAEVHD